MKVLTPLVGRVVSRPVHWHRPPRRAGAEKQAFKLFGQAYRTATSQ